MQHHTSHPPRPGIGIRPLLLLVITGRWTDSGAAARIFAPLISSGRMMRLLAVGLPTPEFSIMAVTVSALSAPPGIPRLPAHRLYPEQNSIFPHH